MDVIVIESPAFKKLMDRLDRIEEATKKDGDRWLSMKDAQDYTGFGKDWLNARKEEIGYFQDGCKDIRFYKSNIDKYFKAKTILRKVV